MDSLLVVSPHLDDGVLSCGQFMAGRPQTDLLTVFAGTPHVETLSTEFDRNSGFSSAGVAMSTRRIEDVDAARILHARALHLSHIDGQYRDALDVTVSVDALTDALLAALDDVQQRTIVAPVGVAHPDHVLVSDAALLCLLDENVDLVLYEELPGRVLWPEQVAARLDEIGDRLAPLDLRLAQVFIGDGPLRHKARAVDCYRSQKWALNRRCLFVPERYHRVVACD